MNDQEIVCPNCKASIKLTESLAAPMIEAIRKQHAQALAQKDAEIRKREETVRLQQLSIEEQLAARLKDERGKIVADEAKKARLALNTELEQKKNEVAELNRIVLEKDQKLSTAQKAEVELLRKQRELDTLKRETELKIEKGISESLDKERATAKKQAEDEIGLKVRERDLKIDQLTKNIEELKKKAEQGSQQSQGEAQELMLEEMLAEHFPRDVIEPVPKGVHGGDVLQRITDDRGRACGTLLWESKRTKSWSDGWLPKLRDDQRSAGADLAIIVSQALPKHIDSFDCTEGIWVTQPGCLLPVAGALRQSLIAVAHAKLLREGQQTKMELIYEYLTGTSFKQRVSAIVEKFSDMRSDLDKERKLMTKMWAKREKQITSVISSTAGMYGDLQGIAGQSIQEIEGLDIKLLDTATTDADDSDDEASS